MLQLQLTLGILFCQTMRAVLCRWRNWNIVAMFHCCLKIRRQVEVLNDKMTCANADLKADIERWHINKRKDFRKLFVNMADRQICYFQKVSVVSNHLKLILLFLNWYSNGVTTYWADY